MGYISKKVAAYGQFVLVTTKYLSSILTFCENSYKSTSGTYIRKSKVACNFFLFADVSVPIIGNQ